MFYRVERHIILKDKVLGNLCFLSKNLYNYVTYILRQVSLEKFENIPEHVDLVKTFKSKNGKTYYKIDEYDLTKRLAKLDQIDYRALPPQTSQAIIGLIYKNWRSFYKSLKCKNLKGRPRIPYYKEKDGRNIVIFTNQTASLKESYIHLPKKCNLKPLKTKVTNFQQVRIIPKLSCYIIEVIYEKGITNHENLNNNLYLSIDLGVNNLLTTSNNAGLRPFIVNGKIVKSINQYYNKKKAILMSFIGSKGTSRRIRKLSLKRECKIDDYLHKSSRFIINYCITNNIKNIVIGYNKEWKHNISIGKANNQKFVSISYTKLIHMIQYKAEENGITIILNEESYTSKCDSLSLEPIQKHETYSGKRIKRGLFQSAIGVLLNADVNGSLNILRKVIGDSYISKITNRGDRYSPYRITPIKYANKASKLVLKG